MNQTFYDILGLSSNASNQDIKKAMKPTKSYRILQKEINMIMKYL